MKQNRQKPTLRTKDSWLWGWPTMPKQITRRRFEGIYLYYHRTPRHLSSQGEDRIVLATDLSVFLSPSFSTSDKSSLVPDFCDLRKTTLGLTVTIHESRDEVKGPLLPRLALVAPYARQSFAPGLEKIRNADRGWFRKRPLTAFVPMPHGLSTNPLGATRIPRCDSAYGIWT